MISESAQAILDAATPSTVQTWWDRVPAAAGHLLGAKFNTGAPSDATPPRFTTGTTAGDAAAATFGVPGPGVGDNAVDAPVANRRVNISARLEHDVDQDGYGDGSQDLCLGDPVHATTACSGALFGSNLQGPYQLSGFSCGYACARVQLTTGGVSTSPAADGVVVRWRMQAPAGGAYHILILEPATGGGYTYARTSATITVGADEALLTFPTRLPIKAGGYVALVPPPMATQTRFATTPAGMTYSNVNDGPVGSSSTTGPGIAGGTLYNADIEPDADHDGYGDVTQDACPSDATTQGLCPIAPPPPPPPPPPISNPLTVFVSFATSAKSLRVSKAGRFSYSFTATPLSPGKVGLKSTKKVKIGSRKRYMALAKKSFTPSSAGKVKVEFKLSSKNLRALTKASKLRFAVTATLGGKTFTTKLTLKRPKKR